MQTILVLCGLLAAVIGVIYYMIVRKRQGKSGCSGCAGCRWSGTCQGQQVGRCPAPKKKNGDGQDE